MNAPLDPPDLRAFRADTAKAVFRLGERQGRWRLVDVAWPYAYIGVTAKHGAECVLRLECSGYPQTPPTGGPWDMEKNQMLPFDRWPKGRGGRVSAVFRPEWQGGAALYLPCDRMSIAGHDNWRTEMPSKIWHPAVGIVHYLELVHELLQSRDLVVPLLAAA